MLKDELKILLALHGVFGSHPKRVVMLNQCTANGYLLIGFFAPVDGGCPL